MEILASPAQGVGPGDFADITTVPVSSIDWADDGRLRITFAADLSPTEQQRVRLRVTSTTSAQEQLRGALAAYMTTSGPTQTQTENALKRAIRLLLSLDDLP